jgi:outer membrane protein OmpA-like peptidoglycan-associated protein
VVQPAVGKVLHAVFYFSPDSAKISAKAAKAIKALAAKVKQTKGYTSLNVGTMGFVYPYDTAANNLKVSTARAKNVAALLKAAGLKGLFVATGKGRAAQKNSKARRVELTISYQLPPKVGG